MVMMVGLLLLLLAVDEKNHCLVHIKTRKLAGSGNFNGNANFFLRSRSLREKITIEREHQVPFGAAIENQQGMGKARKSRNRMKNK